MGSVVSQDSATTAGIKSGGLRCCAPVLGNKTGGASDSIFLVVEGVAD